MLRMRSDCGYQQLSMARIFTNIMILEYMAGGESEASDQREAGRSDVGR